MPFNAATAIYFERLEPQLQDTIKSGDMPFLGLYTQYFRELARDYVRKFLANQTDPLGYFLLGLSKWPASFATYLTLHVVDGYGRRGTHEVYPYIDAAVTGGQRNLTAYERERLWKAYRTACIKLGLSISSRLGGQNYMVDEYLQQAGVPLHYAPDLTQRMVRYAQVAGLPTQDDPEALQLWRQGLLERLGPPLSRTIPRAIEADGTDFYSRLFLRLLESSQNADLYSSELERRMAEVIHGDSETTLRNLHSKQLAIPRVVWREGQLGVELPAGDSSRWRIRVGDASVEYAGLGEPRFVPLDDELPPSVDIQDVSSGMQRQQSLWVDGRNNRLLIFTDSGPLVASTQLGVEGPLLLEPGNYELLLRFVPNELDEEVDEISEQPALYHWSLTLGPGQQYSLTKGPAILTLQAQSKPQLSFEGENVKDIRGNEIFASHDLKLRLRIPEELLQDSETHFKVLLQPSGLGDPAEVDVTPRSDDYTLDLSPYCRRWQPGVTRLLAEVRREDIRRPLVRASIVLWNGLEQIVARTCFHCSAIPDNLDRNTSDNLELTPNLLTYRHEDRRFFRMVFRLGEGRDLAFTWTVPGVFLYLRDHQGDQVSEQRLAKGSTISVNHGSRAVLEIYATASGMLELGRYHQRVDFSRVGCKRLHLASLVEYLAPGIDTLNFWADGVGQPEPLLRLVAPHEVLSFDARRDAQGYQIQFDLAHSIEELRLEASEILTGTTVAALLHAGEAARQPELRANVWLFEQCQDSGRLHYTLNLFLETWPDGAWILKLEIKLRGRWGSLSNARQDVYVAGLVPSMGNESLAAMRIDTSDSERLQVFKRVHQALLPCYSSESWPSVAWLAPLWEALAGSFDPRDGQSLIELLTLAVLKPPETASPSWLPMRSISARLPWLFSRPARSYRALLGRRHRFLNALSHIALMENGLLPVFQEGVLSCVLVGGFTNPDRLASARPASFDLERYRHALMAEDLSEKRQLLNQEDWAPDVGDFLGALHYRFVLKQLEEAYYRSLAGNELRRGKALLLTREVLRKVDSKVCKGWPSQVRLNHVGLLDMAPTDELTQLQENLLGILYLISCIAAACRWESRSPGALDEFLQQLIQISGFRSTDLQEVLGYLLFLGEDALAFYLLLWEAVLVADHDTLEYLAHG